MVTSSSSFSSSSFSSSAVLSSSSSTTTSRGFCNSTGSGGGGGGGGGGAAAVVVVPPRRKRSSSQRQPTTTKTTHTTSNCGCGCKRFLIPLFGSLIFLLCSFSLVLQHVWKWQQQPEQFLQQQQQQLHFLTGDPSNLLVGPKKDHPEKAGAFVGRTVEACTKDQMDILQHQLPPSLCESTAKRPWVNRCSFSFATRCPDHAQWLQRQYHQQQHSSSSLLTSSSQRSAIFVGCNKGMDALNALRMLSNDPRYDKTSWRTTLATLSNSTATSTSASANTTSASVQQGHCMQEFADQYQIPPSSSSSSAVLHCIEAMPITARLLHATAQKLQIANEFQVTNVAMSDHDGTVYFPDNHQKVGIEQQGIANCQKYSVNQKPPPGSDGCKELPLYSLDTFIAEKYGDNDSHRRIDFVSIDVEGFDRNVLLGAAKSLSRIGYLEFEYNWRGDWNKPEATLSSTVSWLNEHHGFVCYWAGTHGNLWRITSCFQSHYDLRHWSNVACVNGRDPESHPMLQRMEDLFHATLAHRYNLTYHDDATIGTNGRQPPPQQQQQQQQ
ncbi:hypothetical protein ACA910_013718 [Epithemia clementina (nom. ined.)]